MVEEERELGYEEDDDGENDNEEDEDEEEEWYKISDRRFAPDPVLPLDISPLIWEDRYMIAKNSYLICLPPSVMESLISYEEGMGITDLLQYLTRPSPIGEEDIEIDLVRDTTWLIQNPQWVSNIQWISAANEEMLENFISHLLDSVSDSVLEYLVVYLGLDSLEVLLMTFVGVSYSAKSYKQSYVSNVDNRAFSIMIHLQTPQKLVLVLYVWSDSKPEGKDE